MSIVMNKGVQMRCIAANSKLFIVVGILVEPIKYTENQMFLLRHIFSLGKIT